MKRINLLLVVVATLTGAVAFTATASRHGAQEAAPIFVTKIPPGYRDWKLVSVAHEAGDLNDIRAILGNELAIKTNREGKLPFPEGTIIARIAWRHVASAENNKVFGRDQFRSRGGTALVPSVYGQGLKEVRRDGRLGVRSI